MPHLLLVLILLPAYQPPCTLAQWSPTCSAGALSGGILALHTAWEPLPAPVPYIPGAGKVQPSAGDPNICHLTPSTGQGSGVFIRAMPDTSAAIVGDIPLGALRPVSAISSNWYQTTTRGGSAGFVAANVAALVGPCGDVPRFVVTP